MLCHAELCRSQFMSIVEALNFLRDRKEKMEGKDRDDVPGRMMVLQHAWYLLNANPNMVLDNHPAAAVKKVGGWPLVGADVRSSGNIICLRMNVHEAAVVDSNLQCGLPSRLCAQPWPACASPSCAARHTNYTYVLGVQVPTD